MVKKQTDFAKNSGALLVCIGTEMYNTIQALFLLPLPQIYGSSIEPQTSSLPAVM